MAQRKPGILIVDEDTHEAETLAKSLNSAGFPSVVAENTPQALAIMQFRGFDVLVLDVATCQRHDGDLINWARRQRPRPRVIAICNETEDGLDAAPINGDATACVARPVEADQLIQILAPRGSTGAFRGTVEHVDIIDFFQFLMLGLATTVVEVVSSSGTDGTVYFENGKVVHAVCGLLEGEQAFYRIVAFPGGSFANHAWREPEHITISKPGEFLLMEAARKRDEIWAGQTEREDGLQGSDED